MEKGYQEFCKKLKKELFRTFKEPQYSIEIHTAVKNNSVKYEGIIIHAKDSSLSPDFYIQPLYKLYKDGASMKEIIAQITKKYYEMQIKKTRMDLNTSYENCKEKIIFRLISYDRNADALAEIPFIKHLDLAVVFYVFVHRSEEEVESFRVTNSLMKQWEVDETELFKQAMINTRRLFPFCMHNMYHMLKKMIRPVNQEIEEYYFQDDPEDMGEEPLILTNQTGINGASVLLYEDELRAVSDYCQGDYYLLPSSIHEVLVIPCSMDIGKRELKRMVYEVNRTCLSEEEFLSDHVYLYHTDQEKLEICV